MERLIAPLKLSLIQAHLFLGKEKFPILRSTAETKETNKTLLDWLLAQLPQRKMALGSNPRSPKTYSQNMHEACTGRKINASFTFHILENYHHKP